MSIIEYTDGRTELDTTAFRYKLTKPDGTLIKDWTTGATWTEEPAGTYTLEDADAVPGTRYAVEPSTGEVGGLGRVPEPMRGTDDAATEAKQDAAAAVAATLALEASVQEVAAAIAGLEPADLGTDTCTLTITTAAGEVVTDARVFVSADATGTVRSAVRVTNALGQVTFDLTDGETFYVWRYSSTVDFSGDNPQEFVAIED